VLATESMPNRAKRTAKEREDTRVAQYLGYSDSEKRLFKVLEPGIALLAEEHTARQAEAEAEEPEPDVKRARSSQPESGNVKGVLIPDDWTACAPLRLQLSWG
jgi:hypothetical protein